MKPVRTPMGGFARIKKAAAFNATQKLKDQLSEI
jgi:hypothetical protein